MPIVQEQGIQINYEEIFHQNNQGPNTAKILEVLKAISSQNSSIHLRRMTKPLTQAQQAAQRQQIYYLQHRVDYQLRLEKAINIHCLINLRVGTRELGEGGSSSALVKEMARAQPSRTLWQGTFAAEHNQSVEADEWQYAFVRQWPAR